MQHLGEIWTKATIFYFYKSQVIIIKIVIVYSTFSSLLPLTTVYQMKDFGLKSTVLEKQCYLLLFLLSWEPRYIN